MRARIQKWGNSLALRIPRAIAAQVGIEENSPVQLSVDGGGVMVLPIQDPEYRLEELLARVTDDNIHDEIDTGPAIGAEFP
jgi:antitoxin MazE